MKLHREAEFQETKLFKCTLKKLEIERKNSLCNSYRKSKEKFRVSKNKEQGSNDTVQTAASMESIKETPGEWEPHDMNFEEYTINED